MKLIKGGVVFKIKEFKKYLGRGEIPNVWHESGRIKIQDERENYPWRGCKINSMALLVNIYNMLRTMELVTIFPESSVWGKFLSGNTFLYLQKK